MMMLTKNERILRLVKDWVAKIGEGEVKRRLVMRGVGLSTADHIAHFRYRSTPKELLASILEDEMKKDGLEIKHAG